MSGLYEKKLASYFMNILEGEKTVELLRQHLARKDNFELNATFSRFDRDGKKFISMNDLKAFFADANIPHSEFNLREIIRHFDRNRDFAINFEEFCNLILTKDEYDLRVIVTQRDSYYLEPNQFLSSEIEYALARIFEKELQLIDDFFEIASEIKQLDFNVYHAFRAIDYMNRNVLTEEKYKVS